jgi:hypothetical protein
LDKLSAGAADTGTFPEAVLAKYGGCRATVAEFDHDLLRDV